MKSINITYSLPLTEIEALEVTHEMWKWLSENIGRTKQLWIEQFQPQLRNMLSGCACCEFAKGDYPCVNCTECPLRTYWGTKSQACIYGVNPDFNTWYLEANPTSVRLAAAKRISDAALARLQELQNMVNKQDCFSAPVAPKQPTLRPWKPEEVPLNAEVRYKVKHYVPKLRYTLNGVDECGIYFSFPSAGGRVKFSLALAHFEHSLDHGKTWQPCGVME